MDVAMPGINGIQATACLRESGATRDVPIIICTAWTADMHREAALHSGAHAVIAKPVSFVQLQTILLHYLPVPKEERDVQ